MQTEACPVARTGPDTLREHIGRERQKLTFLTVTCWDAASAGERAKARVPSLARLGRAPLLTQRPVEQSRTPGQATRDTGRTPTPTR